MANPRRNSQSSENPFHSQSLNLSYSSLILHFLKKPHALPFLLSIFLLLTWASLRLQHSSYLSSIHSHINKNWSQQHDDHKPLKTKDDSKANLVRFGSGFPSPIAKDKRGWLLDPISLALDYGISGLFTVFHLGFLSIYVPMHFLLRFLDGLLIMFLYC